MRACSGLPELWRSIHKRVGYRRVAQRCRRAGQDRSASGDSTIRSRLILFYIAALSFSSNRQKLSEASIHALRCLNLRSCSAPLTKAQQSRRPGPQAASRSQPHHQRSMGCPALLPAARKDHKLQLATDRSAEKSLCVLCALCVSVVRLLVAKL